MGRKNSVTIPPPGPCVVWQTLRSDDPRVQFQALEQQLEERQREAPGALYIVLVDKEIFDQVNPTMKSPQGANVAWVLGYPLILVPDLDPAWQLHHQPRIDHQLPL